MIRNFATEELSIMSRRKNAAAALVTLVTLLIVLIPSCFAAEGAAPRLATVEGNINTNDVLKGVSGLLSTRTFDLYLTGSPKNWKSSIEEQRLH